MNRFFKKMNNPYTLFCLFIFGALVVHAQKAADISKYADWKSNKDMSRLDCDGNAKRYAKGPTDKKSMIGAGNRREMGMYIVTPSFVKLDVDPTTKEQLAKIDKAAKAKVMELFKEKVQELKQKSPPLPNQTEELAKIEKEMASITGLQAAFNANMIPEDFLQSFDYAKACHCSKNSENIAKNESTYNALSAMDLMKLEDLNSLKCFVQSATLR